MASFQIAEDFIDENVYYYQRSQQENEKKFYENRTALQTLNQYIDDKKATAENVEIVMKSSRYDKENVALPNDIVAITKSLNKNLYYRSKVSLLDVTFLDEYHENVWHYLLDREHEIALPKFNYMSKQLFLNWNMRSVLIDWLVCVADEYKMDNNTIHLSVNYLDRFLSNISVIKEKLQLVGTAAMLIAGKVDEIYPPTIKEWSYLTGDAFTVRQIIKMEQLMLRVIDFEVNPPTMLDFIRFLCTKIGLNNKIMCLAMYLSELVLLEGRDYLRHYPSELAAASVVLAQHTLFQQEIGSIRLQKTVGYSLKQLSPVIKKQHQTFKSSPFKEHRAIKDKYKSDKYHRVALLQPRKLSLEDDVEE